MSYTKTLIPIDPKNKQPSKPMCFIGGTDCKLNVGGLDVPLHGIPVIISENIETLHSCKKWEFPYDRFIEYGPEDEWWARKWGFGKEVDYTKPVAYEMKGEIHCNEKFYEMIKEFAETKSEKEKRNI
jgi:hypothetical protein